MKNFSIILASDSKNWLWKDWDLAWRLSTDLKYFKKTTVCTSNPDSINVLLMWRKTWDSIPEKYRPLPWRINTVLTRNKDFNDNWCISFTSIDEFFINIEKLNNVENIFIIGWANIYNQLLKNKNLKKIYLTKVEWDFNCDVFFDWVPDDFLLESESEEQEENWIKFRFQIYKKNK